MFSQNLLMRFFAAFFLCGCMCHCFSQDKKIADNMQVAAIGFYNVENLYDTLNDPLKNDDDFTATGPYAWTGTRYWQKISQLSKVISEMGIETCADGLAMIGLCEVENINVITDIATSDLLRNRGYKAVLIEGPDGRGVDPGFLYQEKYFRPGKTVSYHVPLPGDSSHKTRDILVVSGDFLGEPLAVLVNHWPSRRGGELRSRASRNAAARVARWIADSITKNFPHTKVLIMGDLNDDPINECVKKYIRTYEDVNHPIAGYYFNPMEKLFKQGIGTLAYQDSWNLFDQIMLNDQWLPSDYSTWQYLAVRINNKPYLKSDFGSFKGYPFRTYSGGTYTAGYSDHFASYILVGKKK
jgi:hypothetical protein